MKVVAGNPRALLGTAGSYSCHPGHAARQAAHTPHLFDCRRTRLHTAAATDSGWQQLWPASVAACLLMLVLYTAGQLGRAAGVAALAQPLTQRAAST